MIYLFLQVVELKGNIRVLARIRPLIEKELNSCANHTGAALADSAACKDRSNSCNA